MLELPWELVEKEYTFEGEAGKQSLGDLFYGRRQLVIYQAMFNPETAGPSTTFTKDAACFVCSFWMDNFNGITVHLNHRDITMAAVSIAPYPKIAAYKARMGWTFPWVSAVDSDFDVDYCVSFTPDELRAGRVDYKYRLNPLVHVGGTWDQRVLREGDGRIYHTYSTYARGLDTTWTWFRWAGTRSTPESCGSDATTSTQTDGDQRGSARDRIAAAGQAAWVLPGLPASRGVAGPRIKRVTGGHRRGWIPATAALTATYLLVWLAFGAGCYLLYNASACRGRGMHRREEGPRGGNQVADPRYHRQP